MNLHMYKCSTDCSLHLRVRPPTISSERAKYSAVIKHTTNQHAQDAQLVPTRTSHHQPSAHTINSYRTKEPSLAYLALNGCFKHARSDVLVRPPNAGVSFPTRDKAESGKVSLDCLAPPHDHPDPFMLRELRSLPIRTSWMSWMRVGGLVRRAWHGMALLTLEGAKGDGPLWWRVVRSKVG